MEHLMIGLKKDLLNMSRSQTEIQNLQFHRQGVPHIWSKGEGVWLFNEAGERYLDASGGPMVMNIGHGRSEVAEAAHKQISELAYTMPGYTVESRLELTDRIQKLTPNGMDRIWYGSGGSEAVEAALKFSIQAQHILGNLDKFKILGRRNAYHGSTLFTLSVGDFPERRAPYLKLLPDVVQNIEPVADCNCYHCPLQLEFPNCKLACADDLEARILAEGPETVAAFIAEPIVAAAAGVVAPPTNEYFSKIRQICDKYEVIFIADEVVTGFGRTGLPFAFQHWDVLPDIVVFAKGVASGYAPLAGFIVQDELVDQFDAVGERFNTLFTYSEHPVSCAIGAKVQQIVAEEHLIERSAQIGDYLENRLESLSSIPIVGELRGQGTLRGIEIVANQETGDPFPADLNIANDIQKHLYKRNILHYLGYWRDELGQGAQLILAPPFIIEEAEVDFLIDTLGQVLDERSNAYKKMG
tara:strand:- start:92 stop:1498 length:1407 start_codon:yes stop_codon:yes gene_type:complete